MLASRETIQRLASERGRRRVGLGLVEPHRFVPTVPSARIQLGTR
jgi:hypothetical protein